jgi:hypothetical protein
VSADSWVLLGVLAAVVVVIAYCLTLLDHGGDDGDTGRDELP